MLHKNGFNTQPPEGGWDSFNDVIYQAKKFQHTAARRRLVGVRMRYFWDYCGFNTQPPEGGWVVK